MAAVRLALASTSPLSSHDVGISRISALNTSQTVITQNFPQNYAHENRNPGRKQKKLGIMRDHLK